MDDALSTARRSYTGEVGRLAVSLALVGLAATGAAFVQTDRDSWYSALNRAPWNPPDWVFAPVWSVLYVLMAVAAWLVARRGTSRPAAVAALTAYGVQLALNAAWTPVFFGAHAPAWALFILSALVAALGLTVALFRRVNRTAALLLLPYVAWTVYAWTLNAWVVAAN